MPLPYAAEDHQRVNAMVLVNAGAAMMIDDKEVSSLLVEKVLELGSNPQHLLDCSQSAKNLFTANADQVIAELIIQHLKKSDA